MIVTILGSAVASLEATVVNSGADFEDASALAEGFSTARLADDGSVA